MAEFGLSGIDPQAVRQQAQRERLYRAMEDDPAPVAAKPRDFQQGVVENIVALGKRIDVVEEIIRQAMPGEVSRGQFIELKERVAEMLFAPKPPPGTVTEERLQEFAQQILGAVSQMLPQPAPVLEPEPVPAPEPEKPAKKK